MELEEAKLFNPKKIKIFEKINVKKVYPKDLKFLKADNKFLNLLLNKESK